MFENLKKYEGIIQGIAGLSLLALIAIWVLAKYEEGKNKEVKANG